jgi:hypothetical protein
MTDSSDPNHARGQEDQYGAYGPSMPPVPGWQQAQDKPGVIPLRPLGVGDILNGALSTIRRHPALMLGVAAVVVTITELVALAVSYPLLEDVNQAVVRGEALSSSELGSLVGRTLGVAAIGLVFALVARVFLAGFFTQVVATAVVGRRADFGGIWTRVRPRLLPLLGLSLVYPAVAIAAGLLLFLVGLAVPALAVILAIGCVVVGIWLLTVFSLATPALVLENVGVGTAFGRSRRLVRGSWWRIFGITLLGWLIAAVVGWIVSLPFGGGFAAPPATVTAGYLTLSTIGAIIASTLTEPFLAAITVLLYTDQRIRRENMATELAAAADTTTPPNPPT